MGTQGNHHQIDYIELNVADIARSKAFYGQVFGWTFVDYGPDYTEFRDGRLAGGLTTDGPVRPGGPLVILYSGDLEGSRQRLVDTGAAISKEIFSFPGGRRLHFIDPDGYELAVWTTDAAAD